MNSEKQTHPVVKEERVVSLEGYCTFHWEVQARLVPLKENEPAPEGRVQKKKKDKEAISGKGQSVSD